MRKRSANVAAATGFCLCESEATAIGFYLCESAATATKAAHRTPPGSSALRESEASAANVLSVRKRSVSNKCFICAKAQRQQQMFYLCESAASATNV
ncbi:hypothetical protein, partial [Lysinibacillus sp. RC79]|uniref:hypothetical protein n=1 Tax=Lysinibacillus sp. RC79 TaxID=3156296 RepID=UPI003517F44C